jgi:TonB family protein
VQFRLRSTTATRWLFGAFFLGGGAASGGAQPPSVGILSASSVQELLNRWHKEYLGVVAQLQANTARSNKHALKHARALYDALVAQALTGEAFSKDGGLFLTLLAVAEFRLGDPTAAAWHWQVAQSSGPDLRRLSFAVFPDVEGFTRENLTDAATSAGLPAPHAGDVVVGTAPGQAHVQPPRLLRYVSPSYPAGLRGRRIPAVVVVDAIIDQEGNVRCPTLRTSSGYVAADLAAMETLQWAHLVPAPNRLSLSRLVGQSAWPTEGQEFSSDARSRSYGGC